MTNLPEIPERALVRSPEGEPYLDHLTLTGCGPAQYLARLLHYGGDSWRNQGYPNLAFDAEFGPPLRVAILQYKGEKRFAQPINGADDPALLNLHDYHPVTIHRDDREEFRKRYQAFVMKRRRGS
ncbi:MAG: hypothetical protein GC129_06960 [Proteobacteria bacterium]|nr:hypothetical protein [Pseudomonadota bacterium]